MFKKIKTTTQKILKQTQTQEYKDFLLLKQKWKKVIDDKTQKNPKIIDFNKGELTIKTKNPTWKNELVFFKREIKKNYQPIKLKF